MISVTIACYPYLHKACQELWFDNCMAPMAQAIDVPFTPENVGAANLALGTLCAEDFEEFCIGEESNQRAIEARLPGLEIAHNILNWYFDHMA